MEMSRPGCEPVEGPGVGLQPKLVLTLGLGLSLNLKPGLVLPLNLRLGLSYSSCPQCQWSRYHDRQVAQCQGCWSIHSFRWLGDDEAGAEGTGLTAVIETSKPRRGPGLRLGLEMKTRVGSGDEDWDCTIGRVDVSMSLTLPIMQLVSRV